MWKSYEIKTSVSTKFNENTATVICLQLSKSAFEIRRELSCAEDKDCVWYFTLLLSAQQISMTRDDDSISGVRHTVILQHFKLPVGSSHIKTRRKQTLKSRFFFFVVSVLSSSVWCAFRVPLLCGTPCGVLGPCPGIKPMPSAVKAQILNHWTTRVVPRSHTFKSLRSVDFFFLI